MMRLPEEFQARMRDMLGEAYPGFLASYEKERAYGLRINLLKGSPSKIAADSGLTLRPVPWAADGFYYREEERPGRHAYHEAGCYYIQEPSAMIPAAISGAAPGERILDLCAAPGGKTTQLASAMGGRGVLVSNEIHPERAGILARNVERMGIRNAVVTNEDSGRLAEAWPSWFDRILVDAPCSGEGMFRKDPEAASEWTPSLPGMCAARQDEILDNADRMLKDGGLLVYSTCTFAPEEDEGAVLRFLERHPGYVLEPSDLTGKGIVENALLPGTIRVWPHMAEGEGHFAALLRKGGSRPGADRGRAGKGRSGRKKALPEAFAGFRESFLRDTEEWMDPLRIHEAAGRLWLRPEEMPDTSGLRVLRPGLLLGSLQGDRFEPSHALAMALHPEEVRYAYRIDASSGEMTDYLHGETLRPKDLPGKGWVLVLADGYSAGWGKSAGGLLKNHYPKGLRIRF